MILITETAELAAFCQRRSGAAFVAVDTEFMRDKTYWPQLCLVQVAGPEEAAAIDSLAPGLDLTPLYRPADRRRRSLKVFHAARQDMEIFFHLTAKLPVPIVDTQVAAMVCGFGDSVSYETLASKAGQRADRQIIALHRLGAPAAVGPATRLRALRRYPSAPGLREAAQAHRQGRPP